MKNIQRVAILALATLLASSASATQPTLDEIAARLDTLMAENARLRDRVEQLENADKKIAGRIETVSSQQAKVAAGSRNVVHTDHSYAYEMLDPTTNINSKQKLLLEKRATGEIAANSIYLSSAVTAITDYQTSNTTDKFGWLMRHPTANNQRTKEVSEAVIHSAQLGITATRGDWTTAYFEFLYDPEQSFGAGTITNLNRNQIQLRRGYVLFGNLNESPFHLALGKMETPFGLTDTVNPFTASTVWHAFGGLAYAINGGYSAHGWDVSLMGVQGGAQFRSHNTPVDGSNVPSKLNNFVIDVRRTTTLDGGGSLMLGASYTRGSAYVQSFPVTHFSSGAEPNGAYDLYAKYQKGPLTLMAEFAKTVDVWPGTFNPTIPQFAASKVTSFDLGGKFRTRWFSSDVDLSVDFSRFISGPDGSPWERQDQLVFGVATFITPSTKLFGEFIHTKGFAPLNFISGNPATPGVTVSEAGASSNIFVMGVNAAF